MRQKYTKRQIIESIKYWKNVLQHLDESKSQFLNICSDKFGEDVVFSNKYDFEYSDSNVNDTFNLLDNRIFESKLSKLSCLKTYIGNASKLNAIATSYNRNVPFDIGDDFAVYIPDLEFGQHRITGKLLMRKLRDGIFINNDDHHYGTFAYLMSTLCHEMIHCYDMNFGTLPNKTLDLLEKRAPIEVISYTSHFTPCFKDKRILMKNESGLTMRISGDDKSFDELNKEDSSEIRLLKENDDMSNFVPIVFDDEFKEKYKELFSFNGPNSACMIFGQHH